MDRPAMNLTPKFRIESNKMSRNCFKHVLNYAELLHSSIQGLVPTRRWYSQGCGSGKIIGVLTGTVSLKCCHEGMGFVLSPLLCCPLKLKTLVFFNLSAVWGVTCLMKRLDKLFDSSQLIIWLFVGFCHACPIRGVDFWSQPESPEFGSSKALRDTSRPTQVFCWPFPCWCQSTARCWSQALVLSVLAH